MFGGKGLEFCLHVCGFLYGVWVAAMALALRAELWMGVEHLEVVERFY